MIYIYIKEIKLRLKNTIINKKVNICIRNLDTNRDGKQLNIFERKVYRRTLGPVYDNEKEN